MKAVYFLGLTAGFLELVKLIIIRETGEALAAAVAINLALVAPWVKLLPSERALFRAEFVHHPPGRDRQYVSVQGRVIYRRCSP